MSRSALLFATAAAHDDLPAAVLPIEGRAVVTRLIDQLETLGVRRVWVVTRPPWAEAMRERACGSAAEVTVIESADLASDLGVASEIAGRARGPLVVALGDIVLHREALAGLLCTPRATSAILATQARALRRAGFATKSVHGRLVSAGSAFHRVSGGKGAFLGVLSIESSDLPRLAGVAARLAELAASPTPAWEREFERKIEDWRRRLWRAGVLRQTGTAPPADEIPEAPALEPADERALALRVRAAREDAVALLLAGLVRSDAHVGSSHLRGFFYSRPLSDAEASVAEAELRALDEDRIALDAAVKATDGFFTTFFVSPYSKYIARFAARRGWTPNAMTIVSMVIGVASAAAFAVGSRGGLIAGAVLLQVAFTVDCVDGQLARYTRTFSKLGAWLDSVFDRAKEYLVYAGLAIGSSRAFGDDVWLLAACALALQTARHMVIFSWATGGRQQVAGRAQPPLEQPEDVAVPPEATEPSETAEPSEEVAPDAAVPPAGGRPGLARRGVIAITALERWSATRWAKRIIALPIGERFALISVTAAVASPRATFWALLGWGAVASLYSVGGRLLRSVAR